MTPRAASYLEILNRTRRDNSHYRAEKFSLERIGKLVSNWKKQPRTERQRVSREKFHVDKSAL